MSAKLSGPLLPPASGTARTLMVLLHGYGSDGNDLIGLGRALQPAMPDTLFVAPNAPERCAINPMGYQWFPLEADRQMSRLKGGETVRPVLMEFLDDLWKQAGPGPAQTFVAGFSQGGMLALDVGLRLSVPPLGILSFSGGFIGPEDGLAGVKREKEDTLPPVCLVHGEADDVVPVALTRKSRDVLADRGYRVAMHLDAGSGHTITPEGLGFALAFMREVMEPNSKDGTA